MLTDIFAYRYLENPIWGNFDENARRLLVQGFRIVSEQLFPYYDANGKERSEAKAVWDSLNKKLAMELGLKDLSSPTYGYYTEWNGNKHWTNGSWAKLFLTLKDGQRGMKEEQLITLTIFEQKQTVSL